MLVIRVNGNDNGASSENALQQCFEHDLIAKQDLQQCFEHDLIAKQDYRIGNSMEQNMSDPFREEKRKDFNSSEYIFQA